MTPLFSLCRTLHRWICLNLGSSRLDRRCGTLPFTLQSYLHWNSHSLKLAMELSHLLLYAIHHWCDRLPVRLRLCVHVLYWCYLRLFLCLRDAGSYARGDRYYVRERCQAMAEFQVASRCKGRRLRPCPFSCRTSQWEKGAAWSRTTS